MTRYIDADNIKWEEVERNYGKRNETVVDCRIAVDNTPTIDMIPVNKNIRGSDYALVVYKNNDGCVEWWRIEKNVK